MTLEYDCVIKFENIIPFNWNIIEKSKFKNVIKDKKLHTFSNFSQVDVETYDASMDKFCHNGTIEAKVVLFNEYGNRKTYGGDYLLGRLIRTSYKSQKSVNQGLSSIPAQITDLKNGTYKLTFPSEA